MRIGSLLLRRIHKWIGLILGLQLILWTLSGAMMAMLDMESVKGGPKVETPAPPLPAPAAWPRIREALGDAQVSALAVRPLLDRQVVEVTAPWGTYLFDAETGRQLRVDARLAGAVAQAAHPGAGTVKRVSALEEVELAVRTHKLPIWRVDFHDEAQSSYYVSGSTAKLLERRNASWRWWDFFWMLHNMDYAKRTSFNHPLIVFVAFGTLWLVVSGIWLFFRTAWKPDIRALRQLAEREGASRV
jgi:uncharacterized iron-regulated membrane protein